MLRLFIAVPVPSEIKKKIVALIAEVGNFRNLADGIRPVPEENWHFTLVFLGYQPESAVPAIKESLDNVLRLNINNKFTRLNLVKIEFEKLTYGPPGKTPRMVWLTVTKETSAALGDLKEAIEQELRRNGVKWQIENRHYQAHLTLARFQAEAAEDLPAIERDFEFSYLTAEVNLMRSNLKRTGAEYEILL
ncbi:MAG TPA: RNA 2',3'-cyclic phosphodiesterase [Candidatus Paceibacterota bacterium]|nr:RNA 2',3'-cyclic phosphodiesterase [Candidatus Paceibacterota bacterium]